MSEDAGRIARQRASAALELGRFVDAAREAAAAIGQDPQSPDAFGLLAQALAGQDNHSAAERAALDGLKVDPNNEWLHRLRSSALVAMDRYQEALEAADQAVKLAPDQPGPHRSRGRALAAMRNRFDEARASFQRAVTLDPMDGPLKSEFADLFLDANPKIAEGLYRESLAIDPRSARTLNNLGVALQKQKRLSDAALAFKSAVLVDPTMVVAKTNTHQAVNSLMYDGGVGFGLMLLSLACQCSPIGLFAWLFGGLFYGLYFLVRHRRGKKNLEVLQSTDPQLHDIFLKLSADKAAGRL